MSNATSSPSTSVPRPSVTRRSKIAALPREIREEINERLERSEPGPEIVAWLNRLTPVREILDKRWPGQPINLQNLSDWRISHLDEWFQRREQLYALHDLADHAAALAESGQGSLTDASAALISSRIMTALGAAGPEESLKLVQVLQKLRAGDISRARLELRRRALDQRDRSIDLQAKHNQRHMVEGYERWYKNRKARAIIDSRDNNAERIERIGRLMFGDCWETPEEEQARLTYEI